MLRKGADEITITAGASEMKEGSKKVQLSEKTVEEGSQLYVPIKDIAEALGYTYSYDAAQELVVIATSVADEEAAEEVEE